MGNLQQHNVLTTLDEKPTVDERYSSSYCSRQYLCSDTNEKTHKRHHLRGLLSGAELTLVYCLSRLHNEGIRHSWDDRKVAAAEEIWKPQKGHNHDRKLAYRNDNQRQRRRGVLRYICYNKRCQAGIRTESCTFLHLPFSNALRCF